MKSPKTFLLLSIVVAVLVLGIAYAAISSVTLTVTGNATAIPNADNFVVKFDSKQTPTTSGSGTIDASYTGDLTANISITGWSKAKEKATIVLYITNYSDDLAATLTKEVSSADKFKITANLDTTRIEKGETAELTIVVELLETPIKNNIECNFNVNVEATPANPSSAS